MNQYYNIVYTPQQFEDAISSYKELVILDVETQGTDPANGKLLGVALCGVEPDSKACYVALQWYDHNTSTWHKNPAYEQLLGKHIYQLAAMVDFIGHNYAYDKSWVDSVIELETSWYACTRLMWHIASAPSGPRPYGLKDAQVELLGWDKRGSDELEAQVNARGGKLTKGDHYLADVEVMGKYACMDASSTRDLFNRLKPFYDEHDYWWMLKEMTEYSWLLQWCTTAGIRVDVKHLEHQAEVLFVTKEAFGAKFLELVAPWVGKLERFWKEDRATKYTIQAAKERFLSTWEMQKKFKVSSDKDKRELFYDVMKLPIVVQTEGGKGSTGVGAIKMAIQASQQEGLEEVLEAYEQSESAETLLNSFVKPWLASTTNGRLHPRFNPCGTVSYRLSGFKPYLLNAPFDEKEVMSSLTCDEGWEGVHADFASVEPCVTAHYSQDPSLLKVFKEGKGDVYLDLALTLFPADNSIKELYDPNQPIASEVKEKLSRQRQIAKIIQLAVQYTGTKYTVSLSLTEAGFPTSLSEADALVKAYWVHFRRVAVMNEALFLKFARQGYLRNVVGRIIQVPTTVPILKRDGTIWHKELPRYKDLPNRFIQSSAHDLLSFWVLRIARAVKERGLKAKPVIVDLHDSTSWQAPQDEVQALEDIFIDTLNQLNTDVRMTVPVKMELKRYTTLAGLKNNE